MKAAIATMRSYAVPVLLALAIAVAGIAPWSLLAPLNARLRPDLPWAALAMTTFLLLYLAWLNGAGWPGRWRAARRHSLRLWRPTQSAWSREGLAPTALLVLLLVALYLLWILLGSRNPPPDLSAYPTTVYRVSVVIMGALVSGIVEEAAFRGYLQSRLEPFGAGTAILLTSFIFMLVHAVHGWQALLLLGPGLFIASVLYGMLAYHTGSILPGMAIHVLGDLSYTLFGVLHGDLGLLVAPRS